MEKSGQVHKYLEVKMTEFSGGLDEAGSMWMKEIIKDNQASSL